MSLSTEVEQEIIQIFDQEIQSNTLEDQTKIFTFLIETNYYVLLREENLEKLVDIVSTDNLFQSLIFNSLPRILWIFINREKEIGLTIDQFCEKFAGAFQFWDDSYSDQLQPLFPIALKETIHYEVRYLVIRLISEKWLLVFCLLFQYYTRIQAYQNIIDLAGKTSKASSK